MRNALFIIVFGTALAAPLSATALEPQLFGNIVFASAFLQDAVNSTRLGIVCRMNSSRWRLRIHTIEEELQIGILHRARIEGIEIKRMLSVIINPNRYGSKAADAFCREIMPAFTNMPLDLSKRNNKNDPAKAASPSEVAKLSSPEMP